MLYKFLGTSSWNYARSAKTTVMSCKKKHLCCSEICCLCSGRLQGRRHTHSDNLPEDLQKFISVTSEIYGQCICKACEVSARRNMKRNSGEILHQDGKLNKH